jgi:hypothetical protein
MNGKSMSFRRYLTFLILPLLSPSRAVFHRGQVILPSQNGLLSKAVLMPGEAKYYKVKAGTLRA